jgi:HK97 family phage major capsid protein
MSADIPGLRKEVTETRGRIEAILKTDGELSAEQVSELSDLEARLVETQGKVEREETIARAVKAIEEPEAPTYSERRAPAAAKVEKTSDAMWEAAANRALSQMGYEARADDTPLFGYTANTNDGAQLIPVDLQDSLIRIMADLSSVRACASVQSFSVDAELPIVVNRASEATLVTEGSAYAEVAPQFDRVRVKNFKTATETQFSIEFLADNRGGAMAETMRQHMENHALGWEALFCNAAATVGAARIAPESILTAKATIDAQFGGSNINDADSAAANFADAATVPNLIKVINALPGKYRGGSKKWIMSPAFHAQLVSALDPAERFNFFARSTTTAKDNPLSVGTVLGYEIMLSDKMPSTYSADAVACVLLDRESFMVADRSGGVTTQLDPYTGGGNGLVKFRSWMRSDGLWTNPARSARLTF